MPFASSIVCNTILRRGFNEHIDITPMKLQKLVYLTCSEYAKLTDRALIDEDFAVWQYGPVLPSVYHEFKSYGAAPIRQYAKDAEGRAQAINEDSMPSLKKAIEAIWSRYKNFSGAELSRITHQNGSGWSHAYNHENSRISFQEMKDDNAYDR